MTQHPMPQSIFIPRIIHGVRVLSDNSDTHKVLDPDVAAAEDEGGHRLRVARAGRQVKRGLSVLKQRKWRKNIKKSIWLDKDEMW